MTLIHEKTYSGEELKTKHWKCLTLCQTIRELKGDEIEIKHLDKWKFWTYVI